MELMEDHTENVKEHIQHAVSHSESNQMIMIFAVTSALYAILAATGALLASYHSNEAMVEQIKASDQWSYYQAKSIKMNIVESKIELLQALKVNPDKRSIDKLVDYKKETAAILEKAKEIEHISEEHLKKHVHYSRSVTLFQIAIGMTAFAILIKKKNFWYLSIVFALCGILFLGIGLVAVTI